MPCVYARLHVRCCSFGPYACSFTHLNLCLNVLFGVVSRLVLHRLPLFAFGLFGHILCCRHSLSFFAHLKYFPNETNSRPKNTKHSYQITNALWYHVNVKWYTNYQTAMSFISPKYSNFVQNLWNFSYTDNSKCSCPLERIFNPFY